MQPFVATEGQRFTNQGATPLPERIVESFNMIRFATPFVTGAMAFRGQHVCIGFPMVGVQDGTLAVVWR